MTCGGGVPQYFGVRDSNLAFGVRSMTYWEATRIGLRSCELIGDTWAAGLNSGHRGPFCGLV